MKSLIKRIINRSIIFLGSFVVLLGICFSKEQNASAAKSYSTEELLSLRAEWLVIPKEGKDWVAQSPKGLIDTPTGTKNVLELWKQKYSSVNNFIRSDWVLANIDGKQFLQMKIYALPSEGVVVSSSQICFVYLVRADGNIRFLTAC